MESAPETCYQCGSDNIHQKEVDSYPEGIEQDMYCAECDASWTNVYRFHHTTRWVENDHSVRETQSLLERPQPVIGMEPGDL